MVIAGIDPDPRKADALRKWGRDYRQAVHPFNPGGGYVNFMMGDENEERVQGAYGDDDPKLARMKKKYDPSNFFRRNRNIQPAA